MFEREIEMLKLIFLISKDQRRGQTWSSETAQTQDVHVIVSERGQTPGLKVKPESERRRHRRLWSFTNPSRSAGTQVLMSRAAPVYRIVAQVSANGRGYAGSDHEGSGPVIEFIPGKWMGNLSSRHSDGGLTSAFKTDFSNIRAQRKREKTEWWGGGGRDGGSCAAPWRGDPGGIRRGRQRGARCFKLSWAKKKKSLNLIYCRFFVNKNLYVWSSSSSLVQVGCMGLYFEGGDPVLLVSVK